ncbi:MAG: helix-turn-helix domain-containing protein [Deltaproteobacteria bacterium]|nr:helix-turn-helix domain-containing protein [Deltaproteobacteria bacterium]
MKTLMTVVEVAELLRVSRSTVYAWIAEGAIPFLKIRGVVRFEPDVLSAWVQASARAGSDGGIHAGTQDQRSLARGHLDRQARSRPREDPQTQPDSNQEGDARVRGRARRPRLVKL